MSYEICNSLNCLIRVTCILSVFNCYQIEDNLAYRKRTIYIHKRKFYYFKHLD